MKSGAVFLCFFGAHESATYEEVLGKCRTDDAPWFVTPFDHEWCRGLAISQIIVETMANLGIEVPDPAVSLADICRNYQKAVDKKKKGGKQEAKMN